MQKDLYDFLASGTLLLEDSVKWGNGVSLQVNYYLGNKPPPLSYVSSVRAIVFRENSALVVTQQRGPMYIIPGGRVEKGELLLETLRRELLEEAGWSLDTPKPLGFMHLHHLGVKPENYPYPYPDFLWSIYFAEAKDFFSQAVIQDDHVLKTYFQPVEEVMKLPLNKGELLLLEAAQKLR